MDQEQFQRIAKALADPRRFAILQLIAQHRSEIACQKLVQTFHVTQATISHHLKELQFAGLIHARRDGKCFHFRANRPAIRAFGQQLTAKLKPVGKTADLEKSDI
jgi:ArsR family transcriptional regulator, arsenate/arsenite/antimonite-responsive transcriptional repressor